MHQLSFSSSEHAMKKRVPRRERFLGEMERVVPNAITLLNFGRLPETHDLLVPVPPIAQRRSTARNCWTPRVHLHPDRAERWGKLREFARNDPKSNRST